MPTSEARIRANQQNALRSTGPKTPEGKAISRRNGLKHGLTGEGIVVLESDADEIELRNDELQSELAPKSGLGKIMVRKMATMSVRMERSAKQETVAIASRVRHAREEFDHERIDAAEQLMEVLGEEPRVNLRKLRRSPEGVDLLIEAWDELLENLTNRATPTWTAWHRERAENLCGRRIDDLGATRIGDLSNAIWGDFSGLADSEGGDLEEEARQAWARAKMVERIESEIAGLEAHYATLDHATIEADRREAPDRALFDPSKQATLARRYEAEATRYFFKALKELRQVEAEAAERPEPTQSPKPARPKAEPLGSSWEAPDPLPGESFEDYRERAMALDEMARMPNGRPLTVGRAR